MKIQIIAFVVLLSGFTGDNTLKFMNAWNGKYAYQVKLLDNKNLKPRLQKLLGSQYAFVKRVFQVQNPIVISNGLFFTDGMEAHSGGDPSAAIAADINNNILFAATFENGVKKIYAEKNVSPPAKLNEWQQ